MILSSPFPSQIRTRVRTQLQNPGLRGRQCRVDAGSSNETILRTLIPIIVRWIGWGAVSVGTIVMNAQSPAANFKVIAFYTGRSDKAHLSFVGEANRWFAQAAASNHFEYTCTSNWTRLNAGELKPYAIVLFLDSRPEDAAQREAFQSYMVRGGGWMGFHFAGFALTPSAVPQNWDWYHEWFLGSGEYVSNTWRPTSAILRVEARDHPAMRDLPATFKSAPNEWYRWRNNLRTNADIEILLSIDSSSFPLGTGPKPDEIWDAGDYPAVWTNRKYRMIYVNMGHNDMDYEHNGGELSFTFRNADQNRLILGALLWLGRGP